VSERIRPVVRIHGGDYYEAEWIASLLPEGFQGMRYFEPFAASASVLMRKVPSRVEALNDIDRRYQNLFTVLREAPQELAKALLLTPYHQGEWSASEEDDLEDQVPSVEAARRFYCRMRQSAAGRDDSWAFTRTRTRRGMADVVSGWLSSIDENLPAVVERIRQVQYHCEDFEAFIERMDGEDAVFYCDPPYMQETRAAKSVYRCEMAEADHRRLLGAVRKAQGKVLLAGYECDLYDQSLSAWRKESRLIDVKGASVSSSGSKSKRKSCLWRNYR
jgi:DNA adenine methylase